MMKGIASRTYSVSANKHEFLGEGSSDLHKQLIKMFL